MFQYKVTEIGSRLFVDPYSKGSLGTDGSKTMRPSFVSPSIYPFTCLPSPGSKLLMSPCSLLCRLPDPQRTHVMWATSKVSSWLAWVGGGRISLFCEGQPWPRMLLLVGLRDVWASLWCTVHRKPARSYCCGLPLPLSWPQWPGPTPDGTAAPGPW